MVTIDNGRGAFITWIYKCRFCDAVFALSVQEANKIRDDIEKSGCPRCTSIEALEFESIYQEDTVTCAMCEYYSPGMMFIEDDKCGLDRSRAIRRGTQRTAFCPMYTSKAAKQCCKADIHKNEEEKKS